MRIISKLLGAVALSVLATNANALTTSYDAGATVTSTPNSVTFWDFDGTANTTIGTVSFSANVFTGPPTGSNPVPSDSSNHWGDAFGTLQTITVDLTNPASYVGFTWGTPDDNNTVQVFGPGDVLLATYTGGPNSVSGSTPLNISQFHDSPGTGYFNLTAGPGESIASLVLSTDANTFEVDNFAAVIPSATTPLPTALPMFMGGAGLIGFLARRRIKRAA